MSGYVFVTSACFGCGLAISYNPHHVPSLRIKGERQPLCVDCHSKWNHIHRVSKGEEPVPLHPQAYEALPEHEL